MSGVAAEDLLDSAKGGLRMPARADRAEPSMRFYLLPCALGLDRIPGEGIR